MTKNAENFNDDLCYQLLDFIYSDEESMTSKEVQAELQSLRIDMRPALSKLHMELQSFRQRQLAQETLELARRGRPAFLENLMALKVKLPEFKAARDTLEALIAQHLPGPQQSVYSKKLESAASDDDLRSLLEDILRLAAYSKEESDGSS